jgi:hypothetical protein
MQWYDGPRAAQGEGCSVDLISHYYGNLETFVAAKVKCNQVLIRTLY